jgi:hypothetical protein
MPTFEIQGPDGKTYEIDAPDQNSALSAFQSFAGGKVDPATNQPQGVPEYVPPGVEGYDPQTGEVTPQYSMPGSAAMGAADAATLGWGDELASYLGSGLTGVPRDQVLSEMRGDAQQAQQQNPGSYLAGQIGGGLAQGVATGGAGFGTNAARAGAGLGRVAAGSALDGALYGGAYGAGSSDNDRIKEGLKGALTGGIIGGTIPLAVAGASKALKKAVTPFAAPSERTAAADFLAGEGVPLTAGQRTGSKGLRYAESELGGGKVADLMDQQAEAFTDAAMRRAGGSGRATSDNMAVMADRLGRGFDDISARNSLRVDPGVVNDMNSTAQEYARLLPSQQKSIFVEMGNDIADRFKSGGGSMSGKDYQAIRSRLSRMAKSYKGSDPEFSSALRGLRNALDSGMERSINPADAGAWGELRRQYGNMKTLENAIGGAGGEDAAMGLISPARLRMAASSGNRSGYARGQGDFAELAKAGQAVMSPLPNSGTAARTAVRNLGSPMLAGGGALAGGIPGLVAGLAAPTLAGKALMSAPVQRYLANQAVSGTSNPVREAIIAALLRGGTIPAIEGR